MRAVLDGWTDEAGADLVAALPQRAAELFAVDGHRLGQDAAITVDVRRDAGSRTAVGRGTHPRRAAPRPRRADAGRARSEGAGLRRERASAFVDLVRACHDGRRAPVRRREGWAAVVVADAARRSAADGRTVDLEPLAVSHRRLVRTA